MKWHTKVARATLWAGAATSALVGVAQVTSNTDRIAPAIFGVLVVSGLWFWWSEPEQTMSESIQAVRDEGRRPGAARR